MDKKRVLIVDDEPHLIRSLSFLMSKEGYEVFVAADGEEALNEAIEKRPDLIFLDIMMPRKNGYEVCEAVRQIPELKNTRIIMLSAKGREIDKEKALNVGANDFISKPFSPLEVVSRVKQGFQTG
ncbi:MAG: response regulator [Dehalococcoidales bacterium]|nr:response regulator [Dehalococcoidales bacterium]